MADKKYDKVLTTEVKFNFDLNLTILNDIENCGFSTVLTKVKKEIETEHNKIMELKNKMFYGTYNEIVNDVVTIRNRIAYFYYATNLVEHSFIKLTNGSNAARIYGINDKLERFFIKTYGTANEKNVEYLLKSIINKCSDTNHLIKIAKLNGNDYALDFINRSEIIHCNYSYVELCKLYQRLICFRYYKGTFNI